MLYNPSMSPKINVRHVNESFWSVSKQATDVVADEWKETLQLWAAFCSAEKRLNSISL